MRYFIRLQKISGDHILGPFDPIETLRRTRMLRESGIDYFITTEFGVVVRSEDEIRRSEV
jgi:hypothetical protein